jgi:hypothetical protein
MVFFSGAVKHGVLIMWNYIPGCGRDISNTTTNQNNNNNSAADISNTAINQPQQ